MAQHLQEAGWDAAHVSDLGMSRATDAQILSFAREQGYICVTLDADFHALLAIHRARFPSVIRIRREGLKGPALAALLLGIWRLIAAQVEHGAVVTVTDKTIRLRRLPIVSDQA